MRGLGIRRGSACLAVLAMLIGTVAGADETTEDDIDESTEEKVREPLKTLRSIYSTTVSQKLVAPTDTKPVDTKPPSDEAEKLAKALKEVDEYLAAVAGDEAKRKGFSGKVTFGGSSDESKANEASKAKVGVDFQLGTYPGQLRLKVEAAVKDEKNAVREDVTTILANYDYYIKPGREVFGFVERFTDSYLNIDQRYEVGLGMKFEWTKKAVYEVKPFRGDFEDVEYVLDQQTKTPLPKSAKDVRKARARKPTGNPPTDRFTVEGCEQAYTKAGCEDMRKLLEARAKAEKASETLAEQAEKDPAFKDSLNALVKQVGEIDIGDNLTAKRKATTKLEAGLAIGALAEFENPAALERTVQTIEIGDADLDGTPNEVLNTESRKFGQPSDQRFRLSIRPSFVWRLGQRTELSLQAYFKPALDSPRRVDGELDYRADVYARFGWKLPGITKKDTNATIQLSYELHYDNIPPQASPVTFALGEQLDPVSLDLISAKRHRMIELKVEIPL